MDTWLQIDEFCKVVRLEKEKVLGLIESGDLRSKERDGVTYIEAESSAHAIVPKGEVAGSLVSQDLGSDRSFVEKTIGTILSLHEKVLESKEQTITTLQSENQFLKDALFSTQEIFDTEKETIQTLTKQLQVAQEELEFMKKKYRLMWGKVVDFSAKKEEEK